MKFLHLITIPAIILFSTLSSPAQFNTVKYVSTGYFTDINLTDSLMTDATMVISISQNKVEILQVDPDDASNDKMFFESRCMSALKYPAADGEYYYVWKLGDRKMILRKRDGSRYLSLYQTDEYGLPKEYLTFKIKD